MPEKDHSCTQCHKTYKGVDIITVYFQEAFQRLTPDALYCFCRYLYTALLVLPSKVLDEKPDIVMSLRINNADFKDFHAFCNKNHKDYGKVIRAFICAIADSLVTHKGTEVESTLFYLILFLSSVMEREGFFPALEDIQTIKTSSEYPLIQEDGKGKTRLFRVYDRDKHVIHIIPFHKE